MAEKKIKEKKPAKPKKQAEKLKRSLLGRAKKEPAEARAEVAIDPSRLEEVNALLNTLTSKTKTTFPTETKVQITSSAIDRPGEKKVMTKDSTRKVIDLLKALPHGPASFSSDFPEIVETSSNLALIKTAENEDTVRVTVASRSLIDEALNIRAQEIKDIAESFQANVESFVLYGAWTPDKGAYLNSLAAEIFEQLYGKKMKIRPVHAGLDCGVIQSKHPHLQAISLGPTIKNAHTTRECLFLPSLAECYWLVWALINKIQELPTPQG